jgi:hypothetical protein
MIGSYDIKSYTVDSDLDLPCNSTKIKPEKTTVRISEIIKIYLAQYNTIKNKINKNEITANLPMSSRE